MNELVVALLVCFGVVTIVLAIVIPLTVTYRKYKNFALEHSLAIRELKQINSHYRFNSIKNYDQFHAYDNESFYNTISTRDYLTYQIVYINKEIKKALNDANENRMMFDKYKNEVKEKCLLNTFDTTELLKNRKRLEKIEKKQFHKQLKTPRTEFSINVCLELTKINGRHVCYKSNTFYAITIKALINGVNNKRNGYYVDNDIWKSICRVERGKVSNKLRFAIYARDGYRCRKCGRKTNDLEIDHIIPIAKGGKTSYDNLQTLCSYCNKKKGANIETGYSRW